MRPSHILLLLIAASMLTGCATHPRDPWFSQDKFLHFGVSGVLGAVATGHQLDAGVRPDLARQRGMLFTLSIGTGKELYDREVRGTFFSWRDMTWNLLGAACGAYLATQLD